MFVFGSNLHFLEAVADVRGIEFVDSDRLGIIWFDRDDTCTAIFVLGGQLGKALLVHLRDRAMIAGEDDHQDSTGRVVREPMYRSVDPRKFKGRGGRSYRKNRMCLLRP